MLTVAMPGGMAASITQAITMAQAAQASAQAAQGAASSALSAATGSAQSAAAAASAAPSAGAWAAMVDRVTVLESRTSVKAFGFAPIPALALGASAVVPVKIGPAQAGTGYVPAVELISLGSVLATLAVTATSVVSATRVDVTVQCSGVLAGGAAFVSVRV